MLDATTTVRFEQKTKIKFFNTTKRRQDMNGKTAESYRLLTKNSVYTKQSSLSTLMFAKPLCESMSVFTYMCVFIRIPS